MSTVTQEALSPETASFLSQGLLKGFIGGEDVESSNGETFITHDPGSGETIAEVSHLQPDDVNRAVE